MSFFCGSVRRPPPTASSTPVGTSRPIPIAVSARRQWCHVSVTHLLLGVRVAPVDPTFLLCRPRCRVSGTPRSGTRDRPLLVRGRPSRNPFRSQTRRGCRRWEYPGRSCGEREVTPRVVSSRPRWTGVKDPRENHHVREVLVGLGYTRGAECLPTSGRLRGAGLRGVGRRDVCERRCGEGGGGPLVTTRGSQTVF